jgi:hypothetical protein
VHIEETFDVIKRAHIATGHGDRDRMLKELGKKYANLTRDSIELFKSMCIDCQRKRVRPMNKKTEKKKKNPFRQSVIKGNNKITELRAILQRESQNS